MKTVTLEQAVTDLREMIKDALRSKEAITIATEDGAVTILPEEEYSSMQETLKLLADKEDLLTEQEWKIEATKKFLSEYSEEDSIYDQL